MKINANIPIPADLPGIRRFLTFFMRDVADQVNPLSEGRIQASYNAATAAPTTGEYQVGDVVRNSAPAESGAVGSKYIITGWMCVTASPLAFRELRCLTGN